MARLKRKASDVDGDEAVAEAELSAAIAAAQAAPADEPIKGLGSGMAPIYFKVPGITPAPWGYKKQPQPDEKPLVFAYLAIRGLGEVPRLMLAEAGAAYEHIAATMGEDQAVSLEWRKRSPNGLMPMMSGLGVPRSAPMSQSSAIIRFLARKYGMCGADGLEEARVDTLFETAKDFSNNKQLVTDEKEIDPSQAKLPAALAKRIESMLQDMGSAADDSAGLNYGQIQLFHTLNICEETKPGCLAKLSPALDSFQKAMTARPRIAAYLASPMRFPKTCNEVGIDGGYSYAGAPLVRSDFAK